MKNNITNPLNLTFDGAYKVNKPGEQSGYYVELKVANDLLEACNWAYNQFKQLANEGKYPAHLMAENGGEGFMPLIRAMDAALDDPKDSSRSNHNAQSYYPAGLPCPRCNDTGWCNHPECEGLVACELCNPNHLK